MKKHPCIYGRCTAITKGAQGKGLLAGKAFAGISAIEPIKLLLIVSIAGVISILILVAASIRKGKR